jgi:hypothetical protein
VSSAPLDASTAIVAPADERVPPEMSAGQLIDADDELPAALGAHGVATDTTAADQGAAVPHGQEQEGQEEEEEQEGMETVPALPLPPPPPAVRLGSSSGGGDAGECGGEGECEAVWVGPGPLGVGFSPGGCPPIIDRIVPGSRAGAIPGLRTGLVLVAVNGERVLVGTGGHSHAEMIGMVRAAAMALESGEAKRLTMTLAPPASDGSRSARSPEAPAGGQHAPAQSSGVEPPQQQRRRRRQQQQQQLAMRSTHTPAAATAALARVSGRWSVSGTDIEDGGALITELVELWVRGSDGAVSGAVDDGDGVIDDNDSAISGRYERNTALISFDQVYAVDDAVTTWVARYDEVREPVVTHSLGLSMAREREEAYQPSYVHCVMGDAAVS